MTWPGTAFPTVAVALSLFLITAQQKTADDPQKQAHRQEYAMLVQETQARGYWVDSSTGLMWSAKDNGEKDLNWHQAMKYCSNLRLAGYSDWRLGELDEMQAIYDPK